MNNRNEIVIGFCGLPGSGKSTAIKAIKSLGTVITMGDIVRHEARKNNILETDENLGEIARNLRRKGGKGILAKKCVEQIQTLDDHIFFVDGLRSWEEVKIFRKYWNFPIIAIKTNIRKRFKIIKKRKRKDDPETIEELKERERREIRFGLDKVIKRADYKIINDSTKAALKTNTKEIVEDIIEKNSDYSF